MEFRKESRHLRFAEGGANDQVTKGMTNKTDSGRLQAVHIDVIKDLRH